MHSSVPGALALQMPPEPCKEQGGPAACYGPAGRYPAPLPRDFVLCSLFTFAFLDCCCLGFLAVVYSFKSRDCKVVGDMEGATVYGRKAKCLSTVSIILSIVFCIIIIILYASGVIPFPEITMGERRQH